MQNEVGGGKVRENEENEKVQKEGRGMRRQNEEGGSKMSWEEEAK